MSDRQTFTITQADHDKLIERINLVRSRPLIGINLGPLPNVQQAANDAWAELGSRMGFDAMSVRPHQNGNRLMFTATPLNASAAG